MSFSNDTLDGHGHSDMLGRGLGGVPSTGTFPSELGFPSVQGDFYRENTDIMRGISIGSSAPPNYKFSDSDFYCEQDDVVRGVTMTGVPMPGQDSLLGKVMGDSYETEFFGGSEGFPNKYSAFKEQKFFQSIQPQSEPIPVFSLTPHEKFQQEDVPPMQPQSQHFHFEPTTVYIKTTTPHMLGNSVLDFLESQVVASVTKVSRKKFTVKADAFLENIMCSTKIRIWETQQEKGEFAVEFQRRAGDPFTFGDVYRQACFFLSGRFQGAMRGGPANAGERILPPPPPLENFERDEADVAPLLDMAAMEQVPSMQAEAASVLAKLACEDPNVAKLLCKAESFDEFAKLFKGERLDITYPAARLLSALVMYKEAESVFAQHPLLKIIIQKVAEKATGQIVRLELVKVISAAVRRCVGMISAETAQELRLALESAMQSIQELNKKEASAVECGLQEALLDLSQYYPALFH